MKIPEILKLALKRLTNLFLNKKDGENDAESESRLQPEERNSSTSDSQTTEETSESTGTGVKNIESRVRNRRFKIKGMIAQPKIVEVKKNGRVVRKMIVRRSTVYPAEVRRAYY